MNAQRGISVDVSCHHPVLPPTPPTPSPRLHNFPTLFLSARLPQKPSSLYPSTQSLASSSSLPPVPAPHAGSNFRAFSLNSLLLPDGGFESFHSILPQEPLRWMRVIQSVLWDSSGAWKGVLGGGMVEMIGGWGLGGRLATAPCSSTMPRCHGNRNLPFTWFIFSLFFCWWLVHFPCFSSSTSLMNVV